MCMLYTHIHREKVNSMKTGKRRGEEKENKARGKGKGKLTAESVKSWKKEQVKSDAVVGGAAHSALE